MFQLQLTVPAQVQIKNLESSPANAGLVKQVKKVLAHLGNNPRHPSLHTHEFQGIPNPFSANEKVFEAYVQNRTPTAYRIFWCYGPEKKQITIIAITPHP